MATVTKPVADEREGAPDDPVGTLPRNLAEVIRTNVDRLDVGRIARAYEVAKSAHAGQKRASGESYVTHVAEVARIMAAIYLDTDTIVAALLHDVVEDTELSLDDVSERFGEAVATIVNGVTKIGQVPFESATEQQARNYRKMLLSITEDVRVILVKLGDRLHNMRTLEHLTGIKRRRIALETREVYAPMAHRLGMGAVRWELEDLAFKFLERDAYESLTRQVRQRRQDREREIDRLRLPLSEALEDAGVRATVSGRPKHLWSIHRKMTARKLPFEEIYDVMAMRVLTETVADCYGALGIVHSLWTPISERFHDYIATPKSNKYQSLHTTVFGPGGKRYEIQIRTRQMHRTAEFGIAAHWRYKEQNNSQKKKNREADDALTWFRQIMDWQKDASEPEEFIDLMHMELFANEIFVFTPKGNVKALPLGATPIDFAYSVHTDVGHHCAGAKVNGRIVQISHVLKNGDTVEIRTDPRQRPSRGWLRVVRSARARGRIRHWIKREEHDSAVRLGRDLLEREMRKARLLLTKDKKKRAEVAGELDQESFEMVLAALGRGDVGPTAVMRQLYPDRDLAKVDQPRRNPLERLASKLRVSSKGVSIQGMENMLVRYSRCCQPVPGDDVLGYITRGRGVSIHRTDCPNVLVLAGDEDRRIEIEWSAEQQDRFLVRLYMRGGDRRGLLSDVAKAITKTGTDIKHADMRAKEDGMHGEFVVEVRDLSHLAKVRRAIRRVNGVFEVQRREHFENDDLGWA